MALRKFWEDTCVRTTLNAWVCAEMEARGQCQPGGWHCKEAADPNSGLSCLFLFSWWSSETLGKNTLLPPRSSPCAPLLFGTLVRAVGTLWLLFIQIHYPIPLWQDNQLPWSDFRNYAKIGRNADPVGVFLVIIRLFISIFPIFSKYMSSWTIQELSTQIPFNLLLLIHAEYVLPP